MAADPDMILLPGTAYTSVDEFTADPRFAGPDGGEGRARAVLDQTT